MATIHQLDMDTFIQHRLDYDRAVCDTAHIDPFCSSSNWILPANQHLVKPQRTLILQQNQNYLLLCQTQVSEWGKVWTPFECSWALASPVAGRHTLPLWQAFTQILLAERDQWDGVFITGMPAVGSLWHHCLQGFGSHFKLYQNQTWLRCVASLQGGPEGYLDRRSSKFRKNLRRALRQAQQKGIEIIDLPEISAAEQAPVLLKRAIAIEERSWKGIEYNGILNTEMQAFYLKMFQLLAQTGGLKFSLARHEGRDIGYIFGAVIGQRYRGLQFSYDNSYRDDSIGSLLQWHTIQRCYQAGVQLYDLGMEMDYKKSWSEMTMASSGLIIYR